MTEAGEGEYEKYLPHFEAPSTSGYVIPYNDDPINRLDIAEKCLSGYAVQGKEVRAHHDTVSDH